jgi:transposase-like protein
MAGSQRYRCRACGHKYTPVRTARGSPADLHVQALRAYVDGG